MADREKVKYQFSMVVYGHNTAKSGCDARQGPSSSHRKPGVPHSPDRPWPNVVTPRPSAAKRHFSQPFTHRTRHISSA
ncbi:hypothetical protein J6590_020485 [Homalodisca vitripennis]|nr:hypothetical protein J6590_020485 [Homalodisca vitripennis]